MKKFASVVLYGCGISLFASSCVQKAEEKKLNVLFISFLHTRGSKQ